jgi:hypothetical protein
MGHRLTPPAHAPRSLDELISALREVFPIVEVDFEQGGNHIGDMIDHLQRVKAGYTRWKTLCPEADEVDSEIRRLEEQRSNAAFITVGTGANNKNLMISFNLVPGEDVIVGYANEAHERAATAISREIADVLGYSVDVL